MPGELFISVHDVGSGADVIQKEKNSTLFPVSQHICCSNAVPSRARRAQGQQGTTASSSLCRLQPALPCVLGPDQEPAGLLLPAPLGAELPPAWPGAAAGKQQDRGRNLHMGVFFCQSLGLCLASAAGWASSTATEWGWDKLFLRSPLLCSSSFLTSPRARSLLSEIPLMFLTLLPIQWLSS